MVLVGGCAQLAVRSRDSERGSEVAVRRATTDTRILLLLCLSPSLVRLVAAVCLLCER
jgi:hypothetical protein